MTKHNGFMSNFDLEGSEQIMPDFNVENKLGDKPMTYIESNGPFMPMEIPEFKDGGTGSDLPAFVEGTPQQADIPLFQKESAVDGDVPDEGEDKKHMPIPDFDFFTAPEGEEAEFAEKQRLARELMVAIEKGDYRERLQNEISRSELNDELDAINLRIEYESGRKDQPVETQRQIIGRLYAQKESCIDLIVNQPGSDVKVKIEHNLLELLSKYFYWKDYSRESEAKK